VFGWFPVLIYTFRMGCHPSLVGRRLYSSLPVVCFFLVCICMLVILTVGDIALMFDEYEEQVCV